MTRGEARGKGDDRRESSLDPADPRVCLRTYIRVYARAYGRKTARVFSGTLRVFINRRRLREEDGEENEKVGSGGRENAKRKGKR